MIKRTTFFCSLKLRPYIISSVFKPSIRSMTATSIVFYSNSSSVKMTTHKVVIGQMTHPTVKLERHLNYCTGMYSVNVLFTRMTKTIYSKKKANLSKFSWSCFSSKNLNDLCKSIRDEHQLQVIEHMLLRFFYLDPYSIIEIIHEDNRVLHELHLWSIHLLKLI